jgi:Domain of unknown function (DUF4062)
MFRKIIKVFLGSPSDLVEERKAAKVIVDEENVNHANDLGYHIDLVGWEDTVSQRRRAQEAINVDLDQCEYFVGLLWKKWGTPPGPDGHPYSSGFEEEYRRSVDRHNRTHKPEISLLFREHSTEDLLDVGPQLKKVLEFHQEINDEKRQYYQKFQDLRDFERKFRAIISKFLKDQQLEDSNSAGREPQMPSLKDERDKDRERSRTTSELFDNRSQRFLEEFIGKDREGENSFTAAEAARFRLLACSVSTSGNDSLKLGTHDANLIYRDLREVALSEGELQGLVSAALGNFESSTVPLWHWIFRADFELRSELPSRTLWGEEKVRRNAFKLLEKLNVSPTDFEGQIDKSQFAELWFSEHISDDLVISALEYLGEVGDEGLEVDWAELIGRSEANIAVAAVRASARIKARANTTDALKFLAQHEGTDLGNVLTDELLMNIGSIETDILRACLSNRTKPFQLAVAAELFNRDALTKTDVQLLCESSEAEVRLIGVEVLEKQGPELSVEAARKILVKPRKTTRLGIFSAPYDRDVEGEKAFEKYKTSIYRNVPYHDLFEIEKSESFYEKNAILSLYISHFKRMKSHLEENILDGFDRFCASRISLIEEPLAKPSEFVVNSMKAELTQSALEVFCSRASKSDLTTIRRVLDKYEISFSTEIVEYLAKHGGWEDTSRIAKISGRLKYGLGLSFLSIVDHSAEYEVAGRAILILAAKRIADAWKLELPNSVRVQFVIQMPKKKFAAFSDQTIIDMLLLESDIVREAVALKAILCLSKIRLYKILSAYFRVDVSYYYNAIFWLDLGISGDRETSKAIALKQIAGI